MAGTSLLALIDDIASILDDVAVMTKVAAKKTAGVLGDDLALNAQQVTGINADRELPVVWAVAKGSIINKVILIPVALLISIFIPLLITPLLMLGGLFLCFEGFEKVFEKIFHKTPHVAKDETPLIADMEAFEKDKIKGAVRTDFILSAEIIVITLGTVAATTLTNQILVLVSIGIAMTVGVYGLVAGIVKLDDAGLWMIQKKGFATVFGKLLVNTAPLLMKFLGLAGTIAMFMVGGGILTHGIPTLHHFQQELHVVWATLIDMGVGALAGGIVLLLVVIVKKLKPSKNS
jgi:predicted DNA repair protein MutK